MRFSIEQRAWSMGSGFSFRSQRPESRRQTTDGRGQKSEIGGQRSGGIVVIRISYSLLGKFVSVGCFIVLYDFYDCYDFNAFDDLTS